MSFRQALFVHRQALTEQLKETEDPALVLHLTSVLLFQASTQCMLHAPGRCVPQIIGTLTGRIPAVCQHSLPQCCLFHSGQNTEEHPSLMHLGTISIHSSVK